ncbi:hypothetical protein RSAG8_13549, partial [Rhizoctonia solani AG-8 WAC10335]
MARYEIGKIIWHPGLTTEAKVTNAEPEPVSADICIDLFTGNRPKWNTQIWQLFNALLEFKSSGNSTII